MSQGSNPEPFDREPSLRMFVICFVLNVCLPANDLDHCVAAGEVR